MRLCSVTPDGPRAVRPQYPPQPRPPGPLAGTTPVIIAAENAVGIKEGGRTGLVAITVSACFGLSVFFAPFLQSIPQVRGAPLRLALNRGQSLRADGLLPAQG